MRRPVRICVCTTNALAGEPRAPKHALALARHLDPDAEVVLVDARPSNQHPEAPPAGDRIRYLTHVFAARSDRPVRFAATRVVASFARMRFALGGLNPEAVSYKACGLTKLLGEIKADVYYAHSIEALACAGEVCARTGAKLVFDSMEFHSDMGSGQSKADQRVVAALERKLLPASTLITSSSDPLADELTAAYGLVRPLPIYNYPPMEQHLPQPPIVGGLRLYWRNAVIAPGARGLQDAIAALALLPKDVVLSAQGNRSPDGERAVRAIAESRGVSSRVHLLEPHLPGAAVKAAAEHMVGLCLEREGPKNHDLTVSNKMFDYHMAGLAVIASDRPSLKAVLEESRGGLVYRSGDVGDLAAKIRALYDDRHLLASLAASARAFALSKGNAESEMRKLVEGFRQKVLRPQSFPRTTP